MIAANL